MKKVLEVVAAVIRRQGDVLLASRKDQGWEFPGGKIEPGETPDKALKRELEEELSIQNALVLDEIFEIFYDYPDKRVHLRFFRTVIPAGCSVIPMEGQLVRWEKTSSLDSCGLLPADKPLAEFLGQGA